MALTLETHRITVTPDNFVECSQTVQELRTRTTLVMHFDCEALVFVPYDVVPGQQYTLFYPAYYGQAFFQKNNMRTLIDNLALEKNEGAIFGTQGTYQSQPSLGIFPRDIETTRKLLHRWLNSNRLFLQDKAGLKEQIEKHIAKMMRGLTDGVEIENTPLDKAG